MRTGTALMVGMVAGAVIASGTGAVAARLITSADIKDGTIAARDLAPAVKSRLGATGKAGGDLVGAFPKPKIAPPEKAHVVGTAGNPAFQGISSAGVSGQVVGKWGSRNSVFGPVAYRKDRLGFVHLSGFVCARPFLGGRAAAFGPCGAPLALVVASDPVFILPIGYRPLAWQFFTEFLGSDQWTVQVSPDGRVFTFPAPGITKVNFPLNGITFLAEK